MAPKAPAGELPKGPAAEKRRPAPLWLRLLLAASSLLLTLLLLECATRLLVPRPAPVQLQDGVYVSQLPLVTGRDTVQLVEGSPLPERKRPGEIRVFVFGESSVQGLPWGYAGSPATILHDQLVTMLPGRDVTVVNMGRTSATTMDSSYFLATIARFSPNFVVFYQGGNDFFDVDRERCAPAVHPWLYAAYRELVDRSRFLWTARAIGPSILARRLRLRAAQGGRRDVDGYCDPRAGFQAWTDLLVRAARETGAQVVVTTPVQSPLQAHEGWQPRGVVVPTSIDGASETYRRILSCELSDGCDVAEAVRRERADENAGGDWVRSRGEAWRRSAAAVGAPVLDFVAYLDAHADGGLRPPLFFDDMHLSLEGYWWLSSLWARQLGAMIGGGTFDATTAGLPPAFPAARYLASVAGGSSDAVVCTLLHHAEGYMRRRSLLIASSLLRSAVALDVTEPGGVAASEGGRAAQLFLGGLRRDLGMDPALPAALGAQLGGRSLDALGRALVEQSSCRGVGEAVEPEPLAPRPAGPAEFALLAPLSPGAELGGYRVTGIEAVRGGAIKVFVERGGSRIELDVTLAGANGPPPPAVAGRYAIFYSTHGNDAEGGRLAVLFAAIVEKNGAVPTPPSLQDAPHDAGDRTAAGPALSPDTVAQITGSAWPMQVGGATIALACLLLLARFAGGVAALARARAGWPRPAAFVIAGLLLRLTVTETTAMNYAPVTPRSFSSLYPGVTILLVWADGIAPRVSPFSCLAGAAWIAGLGCVWHAYFLATELGAPRAVASLVSLGFALWPALVRWGTTDSPHVVALLFWFVAARIWVAPPGGAGLRRRARSLSAALVLLLAMPFLAADTLAWPLAAIALRPPIPPRPRGATALAAAVLLAGVPLLVAWNISPIRPFWNPGGHEWRLTPLAPLAVFYGQSATVPGAVAMLAVAAFGLFDLVRRLPEGRSLALPLVAVVVVPLLPIAIGAHLPINPLVMRNYLPCELGIFALAGAGLIRLWGRSPPRLRAGIALAAGCVLFAEWRAGLSEARQYAFRAESTFLRRALAPLPPGARVCAVDYRMSRRWPSEGRRRVDLLMSYSPGLVEGGVPLESWYLGRADVALVAWGGEPGTEDALPPGDCGYFFEGSVCHLAGDPDDPLAGPEDAHRFRAMCERAHRDLKLEEVSQVLVPGRAYKDSRFDPDPVPLRLYRVLASTEEGPATSATGARGVPGSSPSLR